MSAFFEMMRAAACGWTAAGAPQPVRGPQPEPDVNMVPQFGDETPVYTFITTRPMDRCAHLDCKKAIGRGETAVVIGAPPGGADRRPIFHLNCYVNGPE